MIERPGEFIAYLLFMCTAGGGIGYMLTWYVMELRT